MKSLDEFNKKQRKKYDSIIDKTNANAPCPNGIACPQCGEELWDSFLLTILTSHPPQKMVHCLKCKFKGNRIA